jgi:hypothetical protein
VHLGCAVIAFSGASVSPREHRLAAPLDEERQTTAVDDDRGTGLAAGQVICWAGWPGECSAVGVGRIGGGKHERRVTWWIGGIAAQVIDRGARRELGGAEPFDEVTATHASTR